MWPEVYKLKKADSDAMIKVMKNCFSRHCILQEIFIEIKVKTSNNNTEHLRGEIGDSPHFQHPKVPKIKLHGRKYSKEKKCHLSNEDFLKGLLILRNTPLKCEKSPSELMMGRIHRDSLPRLQPATLST